MPILRSTDEIVVRNLHRFPQVLNPCHNLVDISLRTYALFLGKGLNLLSVLVGTGQESHVIAAQTLKSGHCIGHHRTVSVSYMKI